MIKGLKVTCTNFHIFLGMVKETSKEKNGPRGLSTLQRDRGRPYKCDSPGVLKSSITDAP